ncbi:chaperonin GroEL [Candidatus Gracilibacteria bacterium]|nr:chaperonin GroEL [Candidatus Gracilibacteria bacterium]
MSKQIHFSDEARLKMFDGMEKVAKTVTATIGPKGRNVIFSKEYGAPQITNDGVTIAKEIELEDNIENMGAGLIKEAASKTNDTAGDGTSTATLLTYAMAKEGLREIRSGINAIELKNGMKKAGNLVVEALSDMATPLDSHEEIQQVATISAQDEEVGQIIASAMEKVGQDGVITVEEGRTFGLEVEVTEGMKFDNGYISPYMVSDAEKMEARVDDAHILITDKKISSLKDILGVLESLAGAGKRELVIIAEDIDGEALTGLILNKLKGSLSVLGVKAPGFGDKKKEILQDLAILTGANLITEETGNKLENATIDDLGKAKSVVSTKDATTLIGGAGNPEKIDARVAEIQNQIAASNSDYDKEKLAERVAKLAGGIAVIKVGAASEVEMKEKKLRIEDALNATKAAVDEGIVAGGGVALLKAGKVLENADFSPSEKVGADIVARALSYPVRQIAENAGKEGAVVVNKILENADNNFGYDAASDEYKNLVASGIIDPKKVERAALQNAISIAGMFLTTEALIVDTPKKDEPETPQMPAGGMGMPGMGMY